MAKEPRWFAAVVMVTEYVASFGCSLLIGGLLGLVLVYPLDPQSENAGLVLSLTLGWVIAHGAYLRIIRGRVKWLPFAVGGAVYSLSTIAGAYCVHLAHALGPLVLLPFIAGSILAVVAYHALCAALARAGR
jgi:hypothetical protein